MQNDIWLYKSHHNFETGKTTLQKGAVFETNYWLLILFLLIALGVLWFAGTSFRQQIKFWQTGRETTGIVSDCEQQGGKGSHTTVSYDYTIDGQTYSADDFVSYGLICHQFTIDTIHPVFYLADDPANSGIDAFIHQDDWTPAFIYTGLTLVAIFGIFAYMLQNRDERYRHALLQRSGILLEERVMEIGSSHANKSVYYFARYQFEVPNGHYLLNRIESRKQYHWPKDIQEGDTLHILYVDDNTYCVL
jgi:hypothetical protein